MKPKQIETKEALATQVLEQADTQADQSHRDRAMLLLGAMGAVSHISDVLNAKMLRALQQFQEEKQYEALGFARFDFFLDLSPHSPMSSDKYYRQVKLLEAEGDMGFDLMNSLKIPKTVRRQLPGGTVTVQGDFVQVGDEKVSITDTDRLRQLIKDQADANVRLTRELEEGRREFTKMRKQLDKSAPDPSPVSAFPPQAKKLPGLAEALGTYYAACSMLEIEIKKLPPDMREGMLSSLIRDLARCDSRIQHAMGLISDDELNRILVMNDSSDASVMGGDTDE